jgi:O-antigen/teichoic acid export membrane protein
VKNSPANIIILLVSKGIQVSTSLLGIRLITETLTPDTLGAHYILVTIIALLSFGFLNPMGTLYGRFLFSWYQNGHLITKTNQFLLIRLFLILPALFVTYVLYKTLGYEITFHLSALLPAIALLLVAQNCGFLLNAINILAEVKIFAIFVISLSLLTLVCGLAFLLYLENAYAWLIGGAFGQCMLILPMYRYLRSINFEQHSDERPLIKLTPKLIFYFVAPITITLFLQWFLSSSYRFFVAATFSLEDLAVFSIGLFVSGALFQNLESVVNQLVMPHYLRRISSNNVKDREYAINSLMKLVIPIYVSAFLCAVFLAPWILKILVAEIYHDLAWFVIVGCSIELTRILVNLLSNIAHSELKTSYQFYSHLIGSSVLSTFLYLFVDSVHLVHVMYILLASNVTVLLATYIWMKRLLDFRVDLLGCFVYQRIIIIPLFMFFTCAHLFPALDLLFLLALLFVLLVVFYHSYSAEFNRFTEVKDGNIHHQ